MQIEQLGPYKIGRKLGRGGMGTVYEGVLIETGEPAAIKLLAASLADDEGFRERFNVEIETLRKLRHPNIVRLYGFGEHDGLLYYAMELVDGCSLEDELRTGRRYDWREVTEFAVQTCRALKHAHDRGVIHRDIKPANLLLSSSGEIKLADFGIAKLFGANGLTAAGGVVGTAEYMAPEQTDGRSITARSDLYSLGGVMYTLLAGRPPFLAGTLVELLDLQRKTDADPVGRYAQNVPDALQVIIAELLVKDPDQRIATATVLSRRLEAMRHGLKVREERATAAGEIEEPPPADPEAEQLPFNATVTDIISLLPPRKPTDVPAEQNYDIAPEVVPDAKTDVARRERAFSATADLMSPTAAIGPGSKTAIVRAATPRAPDRFETVSEEDHRPHELIAAPSSPWASVQTILLAAALVLLGAGIWYLVQPPSADRLYERISHAAQQNSEKALAGAKSDIEDFLARYPDDMRAAEVAEYRDTLKLYWTNRQTVLRGQSATSLDSTTPLERAYLAALDYARNDPATAVDRLTALIALYQSDAQLSAADRDSLKLAEQQRDRLQRQTAAHVAEETRLLGNRLDEADRLHATDAPAARAIRAAVVKLYADKPWAATLVERAQAALAEPTAVGQNHTP